MDSAKACDDPGVTCLSPPVKPVGPHLRAVPSRRRRFWTRTVPLAFLLVFVGVRLGERVLENFRCVIPGCVYRSGQFDGRSLRCHIDQLHLRSVINLRGANVDDDWYQDECNVSASHGAVHDDMPTDSAYPPSADELRQWMRILDGCPKPVLIHCQSGIDRTGLLAAVCILRFDVDGSPAKAREQLGLLYGHLPWRPNRGRFLTFLDLYEQWLTQQGLVHNGDHFALWATAVYAPPTEWINHAAP